MPSNANSEAVLANKLTQRFGQVRRKFREKQY
jgi:hypothetical protein